MYRSKFTDKIPEVPFPMPPHKFKCAHIWQFHQTGQGFFWGGATERVSKSSTQLNGGGGGGGGATERVSKSSTQYHHKKNPMHSGMCSNYLHITNFFHATDTSGMYCWYLRILLCSYTNTTTAFQWTWQQWLWCPAIEDSSHSRGFTCYPARTCAKRVKRSVLSHQSVSQSFVSRLSFRRNKLKSPHIDLDPHKP